MEEKQNHRLVWIIVAVVAGLLVSCSAGALAGGTLGYWAGRRAARASVPETERLPSIPRLPTPRVPEWPSQPIPPRGMGGAVITGVIENGPAERAGLREGDIIIQVDGEPLEGANALAERIARRDPGDRVRLTVLRLGRERTVEVKLGRHPDRGGETSWLGIKYQYIPNVGLQPDLPRRSD